ncbi:MAG TPA: (Fe-S)-binding protein [Bacteroidales bacterium]|nr:(Fe-S)-binding protein [Bacteroidales bacterium]HRZ49469.1 (Fe-S)-binding protein [Bacteroidales bacterium]
MQVEIFIPCFVDQIYPGTAKNLVRLLEKIGLEVLYNPEQTCCGQMAFNSGYWDESRVLAEKLVKELSASGKPVIAPSASCMGMIRNYYPGFFHNSSLHLQYKNLHPNLFEVTDYLVNVMNITDVGAVFPHRVTYHDACAALREYGIREEPRKLLANVEGLTLIEMEESDTCCGFGGTFAVKNEPISVAMGQQKVEFAMATGAEYIVSTEASCLMHLQGIIDKQNLPIKTIHIVDVLTSGW